jgi:hypothetical protein
MAKGLDLWGCRWLRKQEPIGYSESVTVVPLRGILKIEWLSGVHVPVVRFLLGVTNEARVTEGGNVARVKGLVGSLELRSSVTRWPLGYSIGYHCFAWSEPI